MTIGKPLKVHCSGLLGDGASIQYERWFWKGYSLVILGRLLYMFIVQVSWETECWVNMIVLLDSLWMAICWWNWEASAYSLFRCPWRQRSLRWFCWDFKDWFWTISILEGNGGLERTEFSWFSLWRVQWSWKDLFWTIFTLGGYGVSMEVMGLMLGEFIDGYTVHAIDMFAIPQTGTVSIRFLLICILGGCGGLDRTDFRKFAIGEGVVVTWGLILNNTTFGGCVVLKALILGKFGVLKELIFAHLYIGGVWWSWKDWFLSAFTFGGCDGLERTDFGQFALPNHCL